MRQDYAFGYKSRQFGFILSSMTAAVVFFTAIGLFYAPQPLSAAEKQAPIVLKLTTSSAKAMSTIAHRFGEVSDLFYLYSADGKGETIELGFPGRLVVSPDQTPLVDLLSDKSATLRINAETGVLEQLFQSGSPAARIEDHNHHIVGILTTKKAMDPIRTGAVMRAPKTKTDPPAETPVQTSQAAEATETAETPQTVPPARAPETGKTADQPTAALEADTGMKHPAPEQKTATEPERTSPQPEADTTPAHARPDATVHETNTETVSNLAATEKSAGHVAPVHAVSASEPAPATQNHASQADVTGEDSDQEKPVLKDSDQEKSDLVESDSAKSGHALSADQAEPAQEHEQPAPDAAPKENLPTGVAFVDALIQPLQYELNDRFWGWRPNDLIPTGDNVANFQLGVLEVSRRSAVILAERMSRTGATATFDPDLENAMNWFMIKSNRYWFPSAESKYKEALNAFGAYKDRLINGQAEFFDRADNLIPLLKAYEDLLGSCEDNLVKTIEEDGVPVSFFKSDDYLFYTKGVVSALSTILKGIEHDFKNIIASRQAEKDFQRAIESCHHALEIDPLFVFNSSPSSILANHRANMAAPVSHARFYLTVLIKALST